MFLLRLIGAATSACKEKDLDMNRITIFACAVTIACVAFPPQAESKPHKKRQQPAGGNDNAGQHDQQGQGRQNRQENQPNGDQQASAGQQQQDGSQQQDRQQAREQRQQKREEARREHEEKREARQQHRIEQGVKHGELTKDEIGKLQKQEDGIKSLRKQFESDGKLSKDEGKKLNQALDDASAQIWAQRHDTEGNQKNVVRLGKDVFAKDEITRRIESGEMSHAEARAFLDDFHHMVNLKRRLATDDLSDQQRGDLQGQYNDLLNKYFFMKDA
jgi:hypothetical protein